MTFEKRIVASLTDIKLISYECRECGAKISFSPEKTLEPQSQCFQCQAPWRPATYKSDDDPSLSARYVRESPFYRFLEALGHLRNPDVSAGLGFRVLLEFEEPGQK